MTLYKLEFEMKNGNFDYIESRNEDSILLDFEDLKADNNCVYAEMSKLLIYGGICQDEEVVCGFNR